MKNFFKKILLSLLLFATAIPLNASTARVSPSVGKSLINSSPEVLLSEKIENKIGIVNKPIDVNFILPRIRIDNHYRLSVIITIYINDLFLLVKKRII